MIITIFSKRNNYKLAIIDVFSGQAFVWSFFSGLFLRLLQKPFLLILRGGNLPNFAIAHSYFVKKLFSWANEISSPSLYLKEKLCNIYPNIEIISNPIDIEKYKFKPRNNISPKLVWLRAFHEIYNPSLVPDVLSILVNNQSKDIEILMVGPDKGDGSLQRMILLAEQLTVDQYIKIITGVPKDQVPLYLNQGDIFINTTNIDNTPVSVIEAMACGLCVVSTNVGGIPYLLEQEVDALLVPPNDSYSMASAIQRILNEPDLSGRLSFNARKKAELFDWNIILPQWEEIINKIMSKEEF
jgi:glycosyltransferase involved in cell wall biosynthesis